MEITARFHFIDEWKGEFAYMKIDEEIVWMDSAIASSVQNGKGINICGKLIHIAFESGKSDVSTTDYCYPYSSIA